VSSQHLYTGAPYNAVGEKLGRALKARQGLETRLAYRLVGCSWLAELEELYVESDSEHSLIPRPSHLQFLIACSMQKQRENA